MTIIKTTRFIVVIGVLFFSGLYLSAQNLFSYLENNDTQATVRVHQDKRIETLVFGIKPQPVVQEKARVTENASDLETTNTKEIVGYRVQIYSGNTQRTAKSEAFQVEEEFQQLLPNVPVYVSFHSPFWKVRAGNCRTMEEAHELRNQIGEAYPQLKKDLYIVRDKIRVAAK
jgi:hypothetical protein